jgi:glucan-binding YG repeat protein/murein tripeptide amidase MpaA
MLAFPSMAGAVTLQGTSTGENASGSLSGQSVTESDATKSQEATPQLNDSENNEESGEVTTETDPAEGTTDSGETTDPAEGTTDSGETTDPAEGTTDSGETTDPAEGTTDSGETTDPAEGTTDSGEPTEPVEEPTESENTTDPVEENPEESTEPVEETPAPEETTEEPAVKNGWALEDGQWFYYVNDEIAKGWILDSNKWYYLNPDNGVMVTGWISYGGKRYYLDRSGAMAVGWVSLSGKWYYMESTGAMLTEKWVLDGGKWYYLGKNGVMQKGWLLDGKHWYYLESTGAMKTGWLYHDSSWFYLMPKTGIMARGWFMDSQKWYYAYPYGNLAQNTIVENRYRVGQSGVWLPEIVNPRQTYTYERMVSDINSLKKHYPYLIQTEVIGKSVDGRDLHAVKVGNGSKEIFINGSHHAREHMTTNLLMEMIDEYAKSYADGTNFSGYNTRKLLNNVTIWFVPMVNPDGVTLVQKGHLSAKNPNYVLMLNNNSRDFSTWKANVRGVDLNRQYPADWATIANNTGKPSPQNYKGTKPLSEPEAIAVYNFTKKHQFKTAVAYHSSGQILYWYFKQAGSIYNRDYLLALKYSSMTGYSLVKPVTNPSGGGFTDWFIQDMKQPGFTPEISPFTYGKPVPLSNYDRIWNENKAAGLMLADDASRR